MAVLKMQSVLQSACFHRKNTISWQKCTKMECQNYISVQNVKNPIAIFE